MDKSDTDDSIVGKLPPQKKLRVEECFAREVLSTLDILKFGNLQFSECPDLIDRDISVGVEVTQATSEADRHAEGLFSKIVGKQSGEITPKQQRKLMRLGSEYLDGMLVEPARWASEQFIIESCEAKLEKLNGGGYTSLSSYHLFIVCDDDLTDYVADNATKEALALYSRFEKRYESIFVSDRFTPHRLLELCMGCGTWRAYNFDHDIADDFWEKAWRVAKHDA